MPQLDKVGDVQSLSLTHWLFVSVYMFLRVWIHTCTNLFAAYDSETNVYVYRLIRIWLLCMTKAWMCVCLCVTRFNVLSYGIRIYWTYWIWVWHECCAYVCVCVCVCISMLRFNPHLDINCFTYIRFTVTQRHDSHHQCVFMIQIVKGPSVHVCVRVRVSLCVFFPITCSHSTIIGLTYGLELLKHVCACAFSIRV